MKSKVPWVLWLMALGVIPPLTTPTSAQTIANGPYYPVPSWDQTLSTNTRFIILKSFNSEAVLDRETGLVWERSPDTTVRDWPSARHDCMNRTVGGRKGWRRPSVVELASLVDPNNPDGNPDLPAGHPFKDVQSDAYWSATTDASVFADAWFVHFLDGSVNASDKRAGAREWCVRGPMIADAY